MTIPMSRLAYLNCKLGNHTCCMLTRGYPLDPSGNLPVCYRLTMLNIGRSW